MSINTIIKQGRVITRQAFVLARRSLAILIAVGVFSTSIQAVAASTDINNATTIAKNQVITAGTTDSKSTTNEGVDNEEVAKKAYSALLKAIKSGKTVDFIAAYKLIAKLTPTQRVHFYLLKYRGYYVVHYLDSNFPYFDVDKYIKDHPEVVNLTDSIDKQREAALKHYLNEGVFLGYSSGTYFDPIVAILAQPDAVLPVLADPFDITADSFSQLQSAYAEAEGTPSTTEYTLGAIEFGEKKGETEYNILNLKKNNNVAPVSAVTNNDDPKTEVVNMIVSVDNTDSMDYGSIDGGYTTPSNPSPVPNDEPVNTSEIYKIRNKTTDVVNYELLINADDEIKNKEYTLMVYLCGTNLESGGGEDSATYSLIDMIRSGIDTSKVNVVIMAGGTSNWQNKYMATLCDNDDSNLCVYSLDTSHFDDEFIYPAVYKGVSYNSISEILNSGLSLLEISQDEILRNAIINSDTMPLVTSTSYPVNFADTTLLTGLIDMTTTYYPADDYGLVFWNHGGGIVGGLCETDEYLDEDGFCIADSFKADELVQALENTNLYKGLYYDEETGLYAYDSEYSKKLGLIGFDACLMASLEISAMLSPYTEYVAASPEVEVSSWNYQRFLAGIDAAVDNKTEDGLDLMYIATEIVEGYANYHLNTTDKFVQPMMVYSSEGIMEEYTNVNIVSAYINELLEESKTNENIDYVDLIKIIRKASIYSYVYGASEALPLDQLYMYMDLKDYLTNLQLFIDDAYGNSSDDAVKNIVENIHDSINDALNTQFVYMYSSTYADDITAYVKTDKTKLLSFNDISSNNTALEGLALWNVLKNNSDIGGISILQTHNKYGYDHNTYNNYDFLENSDYLTLYNSVFEYIYSDGTDDYYNNTNEVDRRDNLKRTIDYDAIVNSSEVFYNSGNHTNSPDYYRINLNTEYGDGDTRVSPYSSGDAYVDFMDSVDRIAVYLVRQDSVTYDEGGISKTKDIDLVVGGTYMPMSNVTASVSGDTSDYSDVTANTSAGITLVRDTFEAIKGYYVHGYGTTETNSTIAQYFDWASKSDLDSDMLYAVDGDDQKDASLFSAFKGVLYSTGEIIHNLTTEVFHLFKYSDTSDDLQYYATVQKTEDDDFVKVADNTSESIIGFYHFYYDGDDNVGIVEENGMSMTNAVSYQTTDLVITPIDAAYKDSRDTNGAQYNGYIVAVEDNTGKHVLGDSIIFEDTIGQYGVNGDGREVGTAIGLTNGVDADVDMGYMLRTKSSDENGSNMSEGIEELWDEDTLLEEETILDGELLEEDAKTDGNESQIEAEKSELDKEVSEIDKETSDLDKDKNLSEENASENSEETLAKDETVKSENENAATEQSEAAIDNSIENVVYVVVAVEVPVQEQSTPPAEDSNDCSQAIEAIPVSETDNEYSSFVGEDVA